MLNSYDSFPLLLDYVDITRFTVSFQVNQSFCLLATNFFVEKIMTKVHHVRATRFKFSFVNG